MMKKNNLDEMQEQKLLKIEHHGMWFAFWALFASIFIQQIIGIDSLGQLAGEYIILLLLSIYILVACIRDGIWDRRLKANTKTNFIASLITGIFVGGINLIQALKQEWSHPSVGCILAGIVTFILTFILLQFCSVLYKRRLKSLESNDE